MPHICSTRGLDRLPDHAILAKARDERRILLTHDLDFSEIVALSGASLPSVVSFRLRNMHPDRVNRYLQAIINQHAKMLARGAIISVSEGRIRMRPLPLKGE
jgi:predicted nuclease of predicted toxin-antitoxin system